MANAEDAVSSNDHVDECVRLLEDNLKKRNVDGQNKNDGQKCKQF